MKLTAYSGSNVSNKAILESNVSWDEFFMRHVYLAASKSKDPSTKIGSILVKNGIIISEGFNGFARGVNDWKERYNDRQTKLAFVAHGEFNAVLNCARHGISTLDSICYTQGLSCLNCTKTLIQAGVKEIIIHHQWPQMMKNWQEEQKISEIMFKEAGVKIRIFDQLLCIKGFSGGKEIQV